LRVGTGIFILDTPSHEMPIEHCRVKQLSEGFRKGVSEHDQVNIPEKDLFAILQPVTMYNINCETGIDEVHQKIAISERTAILCIGVVSLKSTELLDLSSSRDYD
jgi:hypothetical protein